MCDHSEHICRTNPLAYLQSIYKLDKKGQPAEKPVRTLLDNLSKFGPKYFPAEGSHSLLDLGSGATVHTEMVLSRFYDTIYMSDAQKEGNDLAQKWLEGEEIDFDWSPYLSYVAKLEESSGEEVENRVKAAVKGPPLLCDVFEPFCGLPEPYSKGKQVDAVASIGVLAVNSPGDMEKYRKGLSNMLELLKESGFFIYDDCLEKGLKAKIVKEELDNAGLEILEWVQTGGGGFVEFLAICRKKQVKRKLAKKSETEVEVKKNDQV